MIETCMFLSYYHTEWFIGPELSLASLFGLVWSSLFVCCLTRSGVRDICKDEIDAFTSVSEAQKLWLQRDLTASVH